MKRTPTKFHKFLLRWIFKLVVKQGNECGIREIYRELYKAHQKVFTEDSNQNIEGYMHEILTNAVALETVDAKIKEAFYREQQGLKYINEKYKDFKVPKIYN